MVKLLHAWHSSSQERVHGSLWYERQDGTKVAVTNVGEDFEGGKDYNFADAVYVGIVVKYAGEKVARKNPIPDFPAHLNENSSLKEIHAAKRALWDWLQAKKKECLRQKVEMN